MKSREYMSLMSQSANEKKPYGKPELDLLELAADEMLSAGCNRRSAMVDGKPPAHCVPACRESGSSS